MVEVKCRTCDNITNPQTKILGDEGLRIFTIGDEFDSDLFKHKTCILKLKDGCADCDTELKISIVNGIYMGTSDEDPNYIELPWGKLEKCDE